MSIECVELPDKNAEVAETQKTQREDFTTKPNPYFVPQACRHSDIMSSPYETDSEVRFGTPQAVARAKRKLSPGESDTVHLCSGYVIPAGSAVIAFTNAGLEPEQYVSVSVTGYLSDE